MRTTARTFCYWLSGFLQRADGLDRTDLDEIKLRLAEVFGQDRRKVRVSPEIKIPEVKLSDFVKVDISPPKVEPDQKGIGILTKEAEPIGTSLGKASLPVPQPPYPCPIRKPSEKVAARLDSSLPFFPAIVISYRWSDTSGMWLFNVRDESGVVYRDIPEPLVRKESLF